MPSVFTHAVAGAAISTLAPRRFHGLRLGIALASAAAFPDADVVAFRFGIPYSDPLGHRGFSHSLLCAFLVAMVLWLWFAGGAALRSRSSGVLLLVIFLACASHGLLDALTDAGLGVGFFVPLNDARYFFPWRPILTSPLNVRQFFTAEGLAIMLNEITWVWVPAAGLVLLAAAIRRIPGVAGANHAKGAE